MILEKYSFLGILIKMPKKQGFYVKIAHKRRINNEQKTIKDIDLKDKKVLVRCDFNVPLDENQKYYR